MSDKTKTDGGTSGASNEASSTTEQANDFSQQTQNVRYGESVTDIFSRPDTKPLLIQTVGVFVALGIGFGLFGYLAVNSLIGAEGASELGAMGGAVAAYIIVFIASLTGPIVAITTSIRVDGMLAYLKDDLTYATGATGAAVGQALLMLLTVFLTTSPIPEEAEITLGEFTNLIILSVVVTGVVAAATMYAVRGLGGPVRPEE